MKPTRLVATFAAAVFVMAGVHAQDAIQRETPNAFDPLQDGESGHANFSDADTNSDGVLSIVEAKVALPQLTVEDADADGIISQAEAEAALPELKFEERGREGGDAPIAETEFGMIVMALNERDEENATVTH